MMDVTDGTPETPPPAKKPRHQPHYKAIARAAEKLAADRLTQVEDARKVAEMWQNTNASNYRLMVACAGLALAGWVTVLYLVIR